MKIAHMYNHETLENLISATLYTGYIENDIPLSLLLISGSGNGKSQTMLQFSNNKNVIDTMDISQKALKKSLVKEILENGITHLMISDLTKVMSHKYETVNATMGMLMPLMEEGSKRDMYYGQEINLQQRINCGLITGVTRGIFEEMFVRFKDTGLMNRFLIASYEHSESMSQAIGERTMKDINDFRDIKLFEIGRKISVTNNSIKIRNAVMVMAQELFDYQRDFYVMRNVHNYTRTYFIEERTNNRIYKSLWRLLKGVAIMHRGLATTEITDDDLNTLRTFMPYLGLRKSESVIKI